MVLSLSFFSHIQVEEPATGTPYLAAPPYFSSARTKWWTNPVPGLCLKGLLWGTQLSHSACSMLAS